MHADGQAKHGWETAAECTKKKPQKNLSSSKVEALILEPQAMPNRMPTNENHQIAHRSRNVAHSLLLLPAFIGLFHHPYGSQNRQSHPISHSPWRKLKHSGCTPPERIPYSVLGSAQDKAEADVRRLRVVS
jgi:hypothetical protein